MYVHFLGAYLIFWEVKIQEYGPLGAMEKSTFKFTAFKKKHLDHYKRFKRF